jgi:hypothetical protein
LLTPLRIGDLALLKRVVMAPMTRGADDDSDEEEAGVLAPASERSPTRCSGNAPDTSRRNEIGLIRCPLLTRPFSGGRYKD